MKLVIAAGAIAIGAFIATAPAAQADAATVQTQCAVMGGDWSGDPGSGYSCCYKPLNGPGVRTCDFYTPEGEFLGSSDAARTTTPKPRPLPTGIKPPPGSNAGTLP